MHVQGEDLRFRCDYIGGTVAPAPGSEVWAPAASAVRGAGIGLALGRRETDTGPGTPSVALIRPWRGCRSGWGCRPPVSQVAPPKGGGGLGAVAGSQDLCVHPREGCVRPEAEGLTRKSPWGAGGRPQASHTVPASTVSESDLPGGEEDAGVMVAPGLPVRSWAAISAL